jgi:hypothetical protein
MHPFLPWGKQVGEGCRACETSNTLNSSETVASDRHNCRTGPKELNTGNVFCSRGGFVIACTIRSDRENRAQSCDLKTVRVLYKYHCSSPTNTAEPLEKKS